jgi:ABC-type multidrug transport system permease subunit
MVILRIAVKTAKMVLGNGVMLLLLVALPVFQILVMQTILGNATPSASTSGVASGFVDVIALEEYKSLPMVNYFASSTLVQFLLIAGVIAASAMISEKEDKTMMRVYTTPARKVEILAGSLLGQLMVIALVAVLVIAIYFFVFDISWGDSWPGVLIVTVFVLFVTSAVGFMVSGLFSKVGIGTGAMSFVIIAMSFLSDGFTLGGQFEATSRFTINKWAFEAYNKLMEGQPLASVVPNLAILGTVGCVLMIVAVLLYRRENAYE